MSPLVSIIIDVVMVGLLAATIAYAIILNRQIIALRESRGEMAELIQGLNDAMARAETGVRTLKKAAGDTGEDLQRTVNKAQTLRDELEFMIEAADALANRLGNVGDRDGGRRDAGRDLTSGTRTDTDTGTGGTGTITEEPPSGAGPPVQTVPRPAPAPEKPAPTLERPPPSAGRMVRLRARLGVPEGKKAVLYAPTHREYRNGYRPMFDVDRFARELGDEYVLLLRPHYYYPAADGGQDDDRVMDVSGHPSVEDLCIASDALLTDYSSIMFDYAHLDRPIVIHAPDWETYRRTRGVTFDLLADPPGPVTCTEDELIACFKGDEPGSASSTAKRAAFRRRFCTFDDGRAAERIVRRVYRQGESDERIGIFQDAITR